MSKKKLRKGRLITSLDELERCEWVFVSEKPYHRAWVMSWQLKMAAGYVRERRAYEGVRLTNGEYYATKTDKQLGDMLGEGICNFCPLPDGARGVHGIPNGYSSCEGSRCSEALDCWKDKPVES